MEFLWHLSALKNQPLLRRIERAELLALLEQVDPIDIAPEETVNLKAALILVTDGELEMSGGAALEPGDLLGLDTCPEDGGQDHSYTLTATQRSEVFAITHKDLQALKAHAPKLHQALCTKVPTTHLSLVYLQSQDELPDEISLVTCAEELAKAIWEQFEEPAAVIQFEGTVQFKDYSKHTEALKTDDLSTELSAISKLFEKRWASEGLGVNGHLIFVQHDRFADQLPGFDKVAHLTTEVLTSFPNIPDFDGPVYPVRIAAQSPSNAEFKTAPLPDRKRAMTGAPQPDPFNWPLFRRTVTLQHEKNRSFPQPYQAQRWARTLTHRRVGIAVSGGGAAAYHLVPLLEKLQDKGIPIDMISGESGGALLSGFYCTYGPKEGLKRFVEAGGALQDMVLEAIWKTDAIFKTLNQPKYLNHAQLCDLEVPMLAITGALLPNAPPRGAVVIEGPVADAVQASGSAPLLFEPTLRGDTYYIDGGLTSWVPAGILNQAGADLIFAVNAVPRVTKRSVFQENVHDRVTKNIADWMGAEVKDAKVQIFSSLGLPKIPIFGRPTTFVLDKVSDSFNSGLKVFTQVAAHLGQKLESLPLVARFTNLVPTVSLMLHRMGLQSSRIADLYAQPPPEPDAILEMFEFSKSKEAVKEPCVLKWAEETAGRCEKLWERARKR